MNNESKILAARHNRKNRLSGGNCLPLNRPNNRLESHNHPGDGRQGANNPCFLRPASGRNSSRLDVHFSSATEEWATPQALFDQLDREFHFTLDVCSTDQNAKCPRHFTKEDDGLSQNWGRSTVWMNPPYGRVIGSWMRKAWLSAKAGATVVCLVPARTDTNWWHDYAMLGEIRLIKGRVKFGDAKTGAPFPSALIVFRHWLLPSGVGICRPFVLQEEEGRVAV